MYAQGRSTRPPSSRRPSASRGPRRRWGELLGGFLEAGYDVLTRLRPGSRWSLLPYGRYEAYDTQDDVPGGAEDPAHDRRLVTAGLAVKPHPNLALKVDRQWRHDEAESGRSQWNAAVGYLF